MVIVSEGRLSEYLYRRMILLGAGGPVKRPKAEASHVERQLKILREAGAEPETKETKAAKRAIKKNKRI
jgi:hypothetical protein